MLSPLILLPALLAPPLQGPSVKDLFDQNLRALRSTQDASGGYGSRTTTAHVLIGMALGPRAYREDDGPFVRKAVVFLLEDSQPSPTADAAAALALACLDAEKYGERIQEFADRAGMPVEVALTTARTGQPAVHMTGDEKWLPGLPLFGPGDDAASILAAVKLESGLSKVAEDVARAGLAYRWEQSRPSAAPVDVGSVYAQGVDFLLDARGASGFWEVYGRPEPGISALAARALLGSDRPEAREAARKVLDWLKSLQQEDGSIHDGHLPVYVTSVAVAALSRGGRAEDEAAVQQAASYLRRTQADAGEGYSESDKFYGGIGYGSDLRPDLSNLQYALQALKDAGAESSDPAFQRALVFLQRSQNRSESNPETYHDGDSPKAVRAGNDGGGVYYPGNSPAGMTELPDGSFVARSYGSMTYALLKCYVFAGLDEEDPRVAAAVDWINRHWTLEVNPGFDTLRDPRAGFQGLYYYYLSLAEALTAAGIETVGAPDGVRHDWRSELQRKLAELQREDGSWVNELAERWWEGNPVLCTAYSLSALELTRS